MRTEKPSDKGNLIRVTSPLPNAIVHSPMQITGEARGTWYFEATFPVRLVDNTGKELAAHYAQAQNDWMTEEFVPFQSELRFDISQKTAATLVLQKDNPSGLPEHDDELRIPVMLEPSPAETSIQLFYYYQASKDIDSSGNLLCSRRGLTAIQRKIPNTRTPIQDTIRLLLKGELTPQERASGISTEYPLPGFRLTGASLNKEELTLTFTDPMGKTSGGACRAGILWFQIEATARQFEGVERVRFEPETLFQP